MPLKGVSGTGRKHTLQHYADLYGLPLHCIAWYHKHDWDLDSPKAILDRVLHHRGRKTPSLGRLQQLALEEEGAPEPARKQNGTTTCTGNGHRHRHLHSVVDLNDGRSPIRRQIDWLAVEVEVARDDYLQEERPMDRELKFKILQGLILTHHKLSRALPDIEHEAGNSLNKSEVEATWSKLVKVFRAELDALPARLASHPMFRKIDSEAVEGLLRNESRQLLKILGVDPLSSIKSS